MALRLCVPGCVGLRLGVYLSLCDQPELAIYLPTRLPYNPGVVTHQT